MDPYIEPGEIKPFLLHDDALVRQNVAAYFRGAYSRDEDLIPLIVGSCQRYGEKENVAGLEAARHLVLSTRSVPLILELLGQVEDERTVWVLNDILAAMQAPLFRINQPQLRRAAKVFPSTINALCQRLALGERHPDKLWRIFEHFIESFRGEESPDRINRTYAGNLVEALVPHVGSGAASTKTLLERLERSSGRDDWGALYVIDLLGKRRIRKAIPAIIECFAFDSAPIGEHASDALIRIGDVEAIRLLCARMPLENEGFRYRATATLRGFKHPEAEQAVIDLLETEDNALLRTRYCEALCAHYSIKGDNLVRRQIEASASVDGIVLKAGMLATSIIRGRDLSQAATWREEISNPQRKRIGPALVPHPLPGEGSCHSGVLRFSPR
jgi:hypothetical protein